ncbi:MAG: sigma 54-interacting transcriptional regulator [Victivallales bacterium]|nr:sigma 54-interacting transcriptional regulator [Victivallales bacterium]
MPNGDGTLPAITPELIIDTMAEGLAVLDTAARVRLWNRAMTEITGYSEAEMSGEPIFKLRAPGCTSSEKMVALLHNDPTHPDCINGCECRMLNKQGEAIPVLVNARTLRAPDGAVIGILQTITDFRPVEKLRREVEMLQQQIDPEENFAGMVGHSRIMRELFRLIRLAAGSDASVLIQGESGTGKELAAAAVHQYSSRRTQPFIRVNCGALPETLLESELFGHIRGAFTGAHRDRIGRFEAANGGSIFLDEIGEISAAMQVKLLRVVQEGEFERVGENVTRRADVRIIAATNRDLLNEVKNGRFREDLYYRLRVFPLTIPPLRRRTEDIPAMISYFARQLREKTGRHPVGINPAALHCCMVYPWPGNVRELRNTMEYAFADCPDQRPIRPEHLPEEVRNYTPTPPPQVLPATAAMPATPPTGRGCRADAGKILADPAGLRQLLDDSGGNKAEAARRLGVSRTLIWKWMKKHGMPL